MKEFGNVFSKIFKSLTSDNSSEFAKLTESLVDQMAVYFTHTCTPCERGTNENHNQIIRRYAPKEASFDTYDLKKLEE